MPSVYPRSSSIWVVERWDLETLKASCSLFSVDGSHTHLFLCSQHHWVATLEEIRATSSHLQRKGSLKVAFVVL